MVRRATRAQARQAAQLVLPPEALAKDREPAAPVVLLAEPEEGPAAPAVAQAVNKPDNQLCWPSSATWPARASARRFGNCKTGLMVARRATPLGAVESAA